MTTYTNFLQLVICLMNAPTRASLIEAAQQIQHAPHYWQRERAGGIVRRKLEEFKKQ